MRFGPVYVLGAVGRNTTNHAVWDVVNLYGSVEKSFMKTFSNTVMCCMVYKNQQGQKSTDVVQRDVFKSKVYNFTHPTEEERTAETVNWFHVACPNAQHLNGGLPFAAGLSSKDTGCDKENNENYIKIEYPFQEPGFKIAIGTQIAYQNINAELIIEWMETYKYLQVDKVVSFYHRNINKDALKVLTYYHNTGFVDLFEIALPAEGELHQENMSVICIPPYTPLYITKLGYAGVYLFSLFLLQNIDCGYPLEPPRRGGSNEYPQSIF